MSLLPAKHTFTAWRGATFSKTLTYRDGDHSSAPKDLTGYTGSFIIRDTSGVTLLTLNTTNGGVVLGGSAGTIFITIDEAVTATLPWTSGVHELRLTGDGDTEALLYGKFVIRGITTSP